MTENVDVIGQIWQWTAPIGSRVTLLFVGIEFHSGFNYNLNRAIVLDCDSEYMDVGQIVTFEGPHRSIFKDSWKRLDGGDA